LGRGGTSCTMGVASKADAIAALLSIVGTTRAPFPIRGPAYCDSHPLSTTRVVPFPRCPPPTHVLHGQQLLESLRLANRQLLRHVSGWCHQTRRRLRKLGGICLSHRRQRPGGGLCGEPVRRLSLSAVFDVASAERC
jgi:hypothetical protein